MSMFCCESRCRCVLGAIIASVIIGVVAAFLQISEIISVTPAFLWVLLGIAVVYLAVLVAAAAFGSDGGRCSCRCSTLSTLLVGILGTVLFSVVLLGIEFAATSVVGAILAGLLLASFSLTIASSACLVKCLGDCND